MKSWKPAVQVFGETGWSYNGLRFATEAEALASAEELRGRWMMVENIAAHPSDDPVTHRFIDGKNVITPEAEDDLPAVSTDAPTAA